MVHDQSARLDQPAQLGEIARQLGAPDVLEHAHRGDLVVRRAFVQLAVVEQLHAHPPEQAFFLDQAVDIGMLIAR
ncbi:Uncharacterised protein [Bordetella pertussis]|nr:Uncharacterised protein [Bordetella pertussis]